MMGTAVLVYRTGGSQHSGINRGHKRFLLNQASMKSSIILEIQNGKTKQLNYIKFLIITKTILEAKHQRSKEAIRIRMF